MGLKGAPACLGCEECQSANADPLEPHAPMVCDSHRFPHRARSSSGLVTGKTASSLARPPRHRHDLHHQTPIRSGSNRSRPSTMASSPSSAPALTPTSTRSSPTRDSTPPCTFTFNWTHKPVGPTGRRGIQPTSFWVEPVTGLGQAGQKSGSNRTQQNSTIQVLGRTRHGSGSNRTEVWVKPGHEHRLWV